jgi:hypothetical protein
LRTSIANQVSIGLTHERDEGEVEGIAEKSGACGLSGEHTGPAFDAELVLEPQTQATSRTIDFLPAPTRRPWPDSSPGSRNVLSRVRDRNLGDSCDFAIARTAAAARSLGIAVQISMIASRRANASHWRCRVGESIRIATSASARLWHRAAAVPASPSRRG